MLRLALITFFCFFLLHGSGQQPLYSNTRWFKVEDGLPQSFISGLQQDKDGFLWVGTRDGLARYDGRSFRVFRHKNQDSLSLSSNVITDLFLDPQNLLWVFYINEKLDCFDPRLMQVVYRDSFKAVRQLLADLKIKKFSRDRSGRFWFNTTKKGIVSFYPGKQETTWFDSAHQNLLSNKCFGLVESTDGNMYAFIEKGIQRLAVRGQEDNYFVPFHPGMAVTFNPVITYPVSAIPDGRLVLAERNRLILFDPATKKFSEYNIPGNTDSAGVMTQALDLGEDGLLYVASGGSVYRFEKNNSFTWIWQSGNSNPFANDCKSFLVDHSDVVWFGTNAGGIGKIDLHALPFKNSSYKINFSTDVLERLVGNSNNVPASFRVGKWAYAFRSCYDEKNRLWLSYIDNESEEVSPSVYVLDETNTLRKISFPPGNYRAIKGLSLSPSGVIHAADLDGNFWHWPDDKGLPVFTPSILPLANDRSSVVDLEADKDCYWISSNKQGLFKIQNNKIVKHFSDASVDQWPTDQLTDLCQDPNSTDILWVGTLGGGLIQLKKSTGSFRVYSTEDGLPNNTIYSIVPDKTGNLWISTNNGITRFAADGSGFSNFDVKDGLLGNEFNRFHHFRYPDGRIAFGGPDGFTVFDPSGFKQDNFQTSVELTGLQVNNQPFELKGDKLTLPYNRNYIQFEFAGLQFNQPEKIRYRYMLKGYDKEWILSNHNVASYTRLPPGRYTLLLNASNTSANWSPLVKELSLRITPPIWATWWAYTIYAVLALLALRLYWRYRSGRIRLQNQIALEHGRAAQLKELDELKDRFFANITHELRTPLTLILTPLEKIIAEGKQGSAEQQVLGTAHRNAEQLLRLINQLLDISKIEAGQMLLHYKTGNLAEWVESCVENFLFQAKTAGIQLDFVNKGVEGTYLFDEEKWEKIIFNLLSNAIKFTPAGGEVHVFLDAEEISGKKDRVRLVISDTGKGIAAEELPKLFDRFYMVDGSAIKSQPGSGIGLALVKELVLLMNGTVSADSMPGKGSRFTVAVPLEKAFAASPGSVSLSPAVVQNEPTNKNDQHLVLLVEDNEELMAFLADSLAPRWPVIKAKNGKQAWELAVAELPDFIISDLMMPEMDGLELCSRIKEDPRTGHIGFILLTARAGLESRLSGLKKGADEYLTKPFHLDELELRLHNLVEQQQRLRQYFQKELLPVNAPEKLPQIRDIFLGKLCEKLEEKIDDPQMSVEKLASLVNMSQRTLNRKLKAIVNLTPVEFIRNYRLQKAATLISAGHGITDTAYSVGFETPSYFAQCFKEQFGKTPSEFAAQKTA